MPTQFDNFQDWVTGGGGEGDPALSTGDIEINMDDDIAMLGTVHTSLDNMPATASARPNGTFYDYDDLKRYLEDGGLVIVDDVEGIIPNPIVHIYKYFNDDYQQIEYEVYIDDQTP